MLTKALAMLSITSCIALAQPDAHEPPPYGEPDPVEIITDEDAAANPDLLRKRLNQTLAFAQRIIEKHQVALDQLDAGEDPAEVMRQLRAPDLRRVNLSAAPTPPPTQDNDHRARRRPQLSEHEFTQVREFITECLPHADEKIRTIEESSPRGAQRLVTQLSPKILEILRLQSESPEMADIKLVELQAGLEYIDASNHYATLLQSQNPDQSEIDATLARIRKAASMRFDSQLLLKQFEIHELTGRIEQLHAGIDKLSEQRAEQVEAQVNAAQARATRRADGRTRQGNPGARNEN